MNLFVGRALHLDPRQLIGNGAAASCPDRDLLHTPHMFVCLELRPSWGIWLPLRGSAAPGRVEVTGDSRVGRGEWRNGIYYYDHKQLWFIPHAAVSIAAKGDHSEDSYPNRLVSAAVPKVWDLVDAWPYQRERVHVLRQRFIRRYQDG